MKYRELFSLEPGLVHLNHAGLAPWPRDTVRAVTRFAYENARWSSRRQARWLDEERRLRELGRWLLDAASPDEIALLKNTSEGISMLAAGLPWRDGDNIVLAADEFPSNRIPWEAAAERAAVELRRVELAAADDPEQALLARVDERTRVLAASSVHYATGLRLDLKRLGDALRDAPALFCVDAIQSLGAHPVSVRECRIDCLAADAHKWMLGPEGVALFWLRPGLYDGLRLSQHGWHMVEAAGDYARPDWRPAPDARRFECGSLNTLGIYALRASLELLRSVGLREIEERIADRVGQLDRAVRALGCAVRTPERRAGILTFAPPGGDARRVCKRLLERRVLCAERGGGVRFSPHFYTAADDLQRALEALEAAL